MNIRFALIAILTVSLFFETTLIALPLVYASALALFALYPDIKSMFIAILAGIILDVMKVDVVGLTPIIILVSYLVLELIKKLFELKDYRIVLLLLFAASYIYASAFSYSSNIIWYSFIYIFIGFIIFFLNRQYKCSR